MTPEPDSWEKLSAEMRARERYLVGKVPDLYPFHHHLMEALREWAARVEALGKRSEAEREFLRISGEVAQAYWEIELSHGRTERGAYLEAYRRWKEAHPPKQREDEP